MEEMERGRRADERDRQAHDGHGPQPIAYAALEHGVPRRVQARRNEHSDED